MSSFPRVVLSMDGLVLSEIVLDRERIHIGRRPKNDIRIEDLAISGEHARIITILGDSFLEDLDSTNGTCVNGKPVTRRALTDGDLIDLGKYRLKFFAAEIPQEGAVGPLQVSAGAPEDLPSPDVARSRLWQKAVVRVLDGPLAGREVPLSKARTMLGSPGGQVAAITRRKGGFCLMAIEGERPRMDGQAIGEQGAVLQDGAVFELSGMRMEFSRQG